MSVRNYWLVALCALSVFFACGNSKRVEKYSGADTGSTKAYHEQFEKKIVKVCDGVYVAINYALANSIMVVVDGGKVIIDTTESVAAAKEIKEQFDKLANGPVLAIIYTHTHPDHIFGASVFFRPGVPIWAHERSIQELNDQFSSLGSTLRYRGAKQFGEGLSRDWISSNGIGPFVRLDDGPVPPIIYPTNTFSGVTSFTVGGVNFELHEAPGETYDQIFVWLPQKKALFAGDNIYKAFPNLYSTRGVSPRPVRRWIQSLDEMRALKPEYLVPGHTEPMIGAEEIYQTLTVYRDAIEFVHDSVIRMANQGNSPDEMVEQIKLPPHLANHPYLKEIYGKVSWSVRGIYDGYLGWFDGNPTSLNRLPKKDRASRMIPLMGGREKILSEIDKSIKQGELEWASELADILLDADSKDEAARLKKADALWKLGLAETNPNARCYLLTSALELKGEYKYQKPIINKSTLENMPIDVIIRSFPERLDPSKTLDVTMTVAFEFTDTGRNFTFIIRSGVGEVKEAKSDIFDLKFISTESDFKAFIIGDMSPIKALLSGRVHVNGGLTKLVAFKSYLIRL